MGKHCRGYLDETCGKALSEAPVGKPCRRHLEETCGKALSEASGGNLWEGLVGRLVPQTKEPEDEIADFFEPVFGLKRATVIKTTRNRHGHPNQETQTRHDNSADA